MEELTMIDLENYEGYLMRYADGALSDDERREVEDFLALHPALRDELDEVSDPALRVVPPLATMPGKERLLRSVPKVVPLWRRPAAWRVAAAVALFILVGGVLRNLLYMPSGEAPLVAGNSMPQELAVTADPSASAVIIPPTASPLTPHAAVATGRPAASGLQSAAGVDPAGSPEPVATSDGHGTQPSSPAPSGGEPDAAVSGPDAADFGNGTVMIAGQFIFVETDGLVEIEPGSGPVDSRPDVIRGAVIENTFLAMEQEKSLLGRAIDAVVSRLERRSRHETLASL